MKLLSAQLTNIGCYSEKEFHFENLTLVHGENRSGKSTLVYALFWALFGKHLQPGLQPKDLCRQGTADTRIELAFTDLGITRRLERSAIRTVGLFSKHPVSAEDNQSLSLDKPDEPITRIPSDVGALTSFFREGEMISFLADVSRYQRTMLEKMLKMDNVFVLRNRITKAIGLARNEQKNIRSSAPPGGIDDLALTTHRKQLASLETEFLQVDTEIRKLSQSPNSRVDYRLVDFLKHSLQEKQRDLDRINLQIRRMPDISELEQKKTAIAKTLSSLVPDTSRPDHLQQEMGMLNDRITALQSELHNLRSLESQATCRVCGQPISESHLQSMISEREKQSAELTARRATVAADIKEALARTTERQRLETEQKDILQKVEEIARLRNEYNRIQADMARSETELKESNPSYPVSTGRESDSDRIRKLEARRMEIQQKTIRKQVIIQQMEADQQRLEDIRHKLLAADRQVLLCETAHKAVENALSILNHDLLKAIRSSVSEWTSRFSFLDRFQIDMSSTTFTPLIYSRGYEVKLRQMSKSEQIFLYLLVKLAIGDALGHLGVLVLDDPADGLDRKRKQLMAHLLVDIASRRQVIVTTNDDDFAALFPQAAYIRLEETHADSGPEEHLPE